MICLGYDHAQKTAAITDYCAEHGIDRVYMLSPSKFPAPASPVERTEVVEWADIIEYRYYYRLLADIDRNTLVVVNECLRRQARHDLTYNCMRHFLNQTPHQIVFQYLPIIDTIDDFMILFDFNTRSRWRREPFRSGLMRETEIRCERPALRLERRDVPTTPKLQAEYAAAKRKLFDGLGAKDPHTLPRNLQLVAGKAKLARIVDGERYVGRNNRFRLPLVTYREAAFPDPPYTVFELPHNHIDLVDFLSLSRQITVPVMVSDLKADEWYWQRCVTWLEGVERAYSAILQG